MDWGCVVQRWEAFLHHWAWDTWRRYFRFRGIVPKPPFCDPGRHYIFAHFPHAVFPMGSWLSFPLCGDPLSGEAALMQRVSFGCQVKGIDRS